MVLVSYGSDGGTQLPMRLKDTVSMVPVHVCGIRTSGLLAERVGGCVRWRRTATAPCWLWVRCRRTRLTLSP